MQNEKKTQSNDPKYMNKALHLRDDIDDMCQENKEEEESLAMKIEWMHEYKELKTSLKRGKKTCNRDH